jgi:transketolase
MVDTTAEYVFYDHPVDKLAVNTIRFLSVDAVEAANSGHPGLPLDAAPMAYVLWTRFMCYNPLNPSWFNRDRFVLSAGHGSMLLYSMLHLAGFPLSIDEIKNFRQLDSLTPGHPERELTPGVEVTTGPLGQGFANAVGLAIAEAHLAARFNRPGFEMIDHHTYVLASDGDLMEGVAAEAASLAGHLGLSKLICLYDDNKITLSTSTDSCFSEDRAARFRAYGWDTQVVSDGNDLKSLAQAIAHAKLNKEHPSLILVRTHIGYGSPNKQDTFAAHGSPLGAEETRLTKQKLGWPEDAKFHIPPEVQEYFGELAASGQELQKKWEGLFAQYATQYPSLASELRLLISGRLPEDWDQQIPRFPADSKGMATRVASGKVLNAIFPALPGLIGGSADLNPSTHTEMTAAGDFEHPRTNGGDQQGTAGGEWSYAGRNIHFGVREHAMGAICNGLAAHGGFIPFGATFLTFSDYMRPSIRLAALMQLGVIFLFTHDSLALGEDGPTHQSVEHLTALRTIPRLTVIRPADANETAEAWRLAVESREAPVALILTRQNVPTLDRNRFNDAKGARKGAYVLSDPPQGKPRLILIASGSEVSLIVAAADKLAERGIPTRLVSMPSWELFDAQPQEYRHQVLPPAIKMRLAVEAGISQGWHRYVGDRGDVISVERFGASAPGPVVMRELGFSVENVVERATQLWQKEHGWQEKIGAENVKRIGIATDHGGFALKMFLIEQLTKLNYEVVDFGNRKLQFDDDYPDYILPLAQAVGKGEVDRGIALCGSGVGACVIANKVPGVRACLVHDTYSAHQGVEDDALNVLCLGGKVIGQMTALEIVKTFLEARFDEEDRHRRRLLNIETANDE